MSYTIGIIGSGNIGHALATHLSNTNYQVLLTNSRGPESLKEMVASIGGTVTPAGFKETVERSDLILMAVPWNRLEEVAKEMAAFSGKIIVDATNNIVSVTPFQLANTGGKTTGEYVANLFPTHRVVKAFNTLGAAILALPPQSSAGKRVIVVTGDDKQAKEQVIELIKTIGFEPIDLGTLKEGGKLQDVGGSLSGTELIKVTK